MSVQTTRTRLCPNACKHEIVPSHQFGALRDQQLMACGAAVDVWLTGAVMRRKLGVDAGEVKSRSRKLHDAADYLGASEKRGIYRGSRAADYRGRRLMNAVSAKAI